MIRIAFACFFVLITTVSGYAQKRISFNLGIHYWTSINGYLSPQNPHLNFRSSLNYSLGVSELSIGYNYSFLRASLLDSPYTYNFSEFNLSWSRAFFNRDKHYFNLSAGVILNNKIKGTRVGANLDHELFNSLKIYYPPDAVSSLQSPIYKKTLFYLEVGYKYYLRKKLYGTIIGRSTFFSYEFRYDENNNSTNLEKVGLNYSIFLGLGYTFGKDK